MRWPSATPMPVPTRLSPKIATSAIYGPDSEWVMAFADKDSTFLVDGARRYDSRLWMHYNAVVVTPAMAVTAPGTGSDYGIAGLAKGGEILDGAQDLQADPAAECSGQGFLVSDSL